MNVTIELIAIKLNNRLEYLSYTTRILILHDLNIIPARAMSVYVIDQTKTKYTPNYDPAMTTEAWIGAVVSTVGASASREIKPVDSDVPEGVSHRGFASYLFTCWRDEAGVSLRPDMIAGLILNQIASEVCRSPSAYRHLYTDSDKKTTIKVVGTHDTIIDGLTNAIKSKIKEPKLADSFLTEFKSAPPGYNLYASACMLQSAIPYFNYAMRSCGIPAVEIVGDLADWQRLLEMLGNLRPLFDIKYEILEDQWGRNINIIVTSPILILLDRALTITRSIMYYCFGVGDKPTGRYDYPTAVEFLRNIFAIVERCGSGGPYYHTGWFSDLYINAPAYIHLFDECIAYVPYHYIDESTNWYRAVGLVYSDVAESQGYQLYRPRYGSVLHQVLDQDLFNKIAMK